MKIGDKYRSKTLTVTVTVRIVEIFDDQVAVTLQHSLATDPIKIPKIKLRTKFEKVIENNHYAKQKSKLSL